MGAIKNILFTFDYELFLGSKSGSVENCLIKPTNILLGLFDKYAIKNAIFFVDTAYLICLKNEEHSAAKKDLERISEQLVTLMKKGHSVFPHIHPHWMDAVYVRDTNQWSLTDHSKYRVHNITAAQRMELFGTSMKLLNDLAAKANCILPINGYRAGGWSIQPFTDFIPLFEKHHIQHEFSVVKGFKNLSDIQYFDFSICPSKEIYKFSNDPCVEDEKGNYTQYSISTVEISPTIYWLNKIWAKYLWKTGNRSMGDGTSMVMKDAGVVKGKTEFIGSDSREMISIELLTKVKLSVYKEYLASNDFIHFISHPKMLSRHNLKCFDALLKYACYKYQLQTDFSHMPIN